jgi:hypothetical protein
MTVVRELARYKLDLVSVQEVRLDKGGTVRTEDFTFSYGPCRLRVFENRVLRRIFGPKRGEVTGGWRRLHDVELHAL